MRRENETSHRPTKPAEQSVQNVETPTARSRMPELATVGRKIKIKGEVTGEENLLIEGRLEGSVDLRSHSVTVGSEGNVKANIRGRIVIIEGKVQGDLAAEEQIVLLSSASVEGDLTAPRVVLEDGAYFRGGVDMGDSSSSTGSDEPGKQSEKIVKTTQAGKDDDRSAQARLTVS